MSRLTHLDLRTIRRLLSQGVRHVEIARRFDLAVGTIARISSDRKLRRRRLELLTEVDLPEDDPPPDYESRRLRRCPGCGGMVYQWPCLTCELRAEPQPGPNLVPEIDGETEGWSEGESPSPSDSGNGRPEGPTQVSPGQRPGLANRENPQPQRGETTAPRRIVVPPFQGSPIEISTTTQGSALG